MPASVQARSTSSKSKVTSALSKIRAPSTNDSVSTSRTTARARKSPQDKAARTGASSSSTTINTNANAHLRTDPIGALNTLLKLLTSLPSRIGGCQYKLTPAEHSLSLHLLSILDPFVFHGVRALAPSIVSSNSNAASSTALGLAQQPTEIIDAILSHVDSKKDLLTVGLGCKRLHDIVFPRHYEYRVIRCKVSSISVWNHLNHHRSLARNVRSLEILDERAPASLKSGLGHGNGMLVPKGIMQGDTDLESTDDELTMHSKQERFLAAALTRMTGLKEFKWSCNHSPISIANVWPTLMMRAANLKSINICDNLIFASKGLFGSQEGDDSDSEEDEGQDGGSSGVVRRAARVPATAMLQMENVVFHSTPYSYGAVKQPELTRIANMLHQCANLKSLEIVYIAPRSASANNPMTLAAAVAGTNTSRTRPLADEFLTYGRWNGLTSVILTNLRCASYVAPSFFLSSHPALEVLHLDLSIHGGGGGALGGGSGGGLRLTQGALPRLREIKAAKDIINAVLECPLLEGQAPRPLEVVRGFKLSGNSPAPLAPLSIGAASSRNVPDTVFLSNLKQFGGSSVKRVEMLGWHDMEDVRKVVAAVPNLHHLDLGKRLGVSNVVTRSSAGGAGGSSSSSSANGPVTNMVEWTELLSTLPELVTFHGVRFFYEVSSSNIGGSTSAPSQPSSMNSWSDAFASTGAPAPLAVPTSAKNHISMMERSRMRKNEEIAGVLAWKCRKLRRLDHWEEHGNKVIVLLRDDGKEREGKARWEVRRVKS
ncbi:hypothetical protein CPC08DRAFT_648247 [Agrocybe pediades]|nr:hypothetical protein CPC08DRAFT_648247 [Agrocybe pediades]